MSPYLQSLYINFFECVYENGEGDVPKEQEN